MLGDFKNTHQKYIIQCLSSEKNMFIKIFLIFIDFFFSVFLKGISWLWEHSDQKKKVSWDQFEVYTVSLYLSVPSILVVLLMFANVALIHIEYMY